MLVLIFLIIFLILWLIIALPRNQLKRLVWILAIISIWTGTWLFLFQYELSLTGLITGTYGSDATYYFEAMRAGYLADDASHAIASYWNPLYIWFGIVLLKTSPFFSVIWVKLGNIVLLLYIISMLYIMLYKAGVPRQITVFICLFAGLNGIVTWMCIRNLKDTLFTFLFLLNCFVAVNFYTNYKSKTKISLVLHTVFLIALYFVLANCLRDIRQWAYIIPWLTLISLIVRILMDKKVINRFILGLSAIAIPLLSIVIPAIIGIDVISNFNNYASLIGLGEKTGLSLVIGVIMGLFRFIIGPGPIRAIMGNDVFLVTTNIGNTLIFLGSLMWWLVIPLMILKIKELIKIIPKEMIVAIPFLTYVFIYIYVYQGSVETRFRALLYLISMFLWGLTYVHYNPRVNKRNNRQLAYIICVFFVFISGLMATYFSLG